MSITLPNFWVGLDVHKDSVTAAVFRNRDPEPMRVDRLANDLTKLRRWFERLQRDGAVHVCYEASGAGYVLQRALTEWGIRCELAAPSLIPRRPGEHRKTGGLVRTQAPDRSPSLPATARLTSTTHYRALCPSTAAFARIAWRRSD